MQANVADERAGSLFLDRSNAPSVLRDKIGAALCQRITVRFTEDRREEPHDFFIAVQLGKNRKICWLPLAKKEAFGMDFSSRRHGIPRWLSWLCTFA